MYDYALYKVESIGLCLKSKRSIYVKKFVNRLILCTFAILMLWLTSLEVMQALTKKLFVGPSSSYVYRACRELASELSVQRLNYDNCVMRQLANCFEDLHINYLMLNKKIRLISYDDDVLYDYVSLVHYNCTTALTKTKNGIKTWKITSNKETLSYMNCSDTAMSLVKSWLSDASSSAQISNDLTTQYVIQTQGTLQNIVDYAASLEAYNMNYLNNKSTALSVQFINATLALSSIQRSQLNRTIQSFQAVVRGALACLSLDPSSNSCNYLPSDDTMLVQYESLYNDLTNAFYTLSDSYTSVSSAYDRLSSATKKIVQGANSYISTSEQLISTLLRDADALGINLQVCGTTSPDWCSLQVRRPLPQHTHLQSSSSII